MRVNVMRKQSRVVGRVRIAALVLVVVSAAAGATLFTACQPAKAPGTQSEEAAPPPSMKSAPVANTVSPSRRAAPAGSQTTKAPATPGAPVAKAVATVPASTASAREETVTINGCLARKDQAFRLKDVEGDDAPKARSWKTGFLKKRTADVAVVDAANRLRLSNYVGQRVALTGTLDDREMRARSVASVSKSCS